jgi:N-acetyl-anhydromuramoyl-L-alanine amidase
MNLHARKRPPRALPSRRLVIDPHGVASPATQIASPNCDERPPDTPVVLVVIHGISLPPGNFSGAGVARLFTNSLDSKAHPYYATIAHLRVSSHFFIRRDGSLVQFVPCARRAWHAGASSWRGREHCNDFSIGIELEGTDDLPYCSPQYKTLASLIEALRRRYPALRDVVGHSDVAPGRKTDPGRAFDWPRLRRRLSC